MQNAGSVQVGPLRQNELGEAERIVRLAFGTFLAMPDPLEFMGDRSFAASRWAASHVKALAARHDGHLIGSNFATRWGSFGFFGPLTVLPEYWDRGVAQRLLIDTMDIFHAWGVSHTGLFTFAHSPKHVGLYQKFGYWPRYLTAIMTHTPKDGAKPGGQKAGNAVLISSLDASRREQEIEACRKLTHQIDEGLDLSGEIRAALEQRTGDIVLLSMGGELDAFAICLHGPGSEGGEQACYIKFAAARSGPGAGDRFDALLEACDRFAVSRCAAIEAGVNLAREDAYRRMRAHGYRTAIQGVAMHRPHAGSFNRSDVYVIDDWR
ncbi:MAG: GNAT family N-acetyltransferase [Acidobacteria bacterium]|nr:MAG: GNAT family N-acetyltransferase [Acidobacteriota bacterium]